MMVSAAPLYVLFLKRNRQKLKLLKAVFGDLHATIE
jgi:hypothetical protein